MKTPESLKEGLEMAKRKLLEEGASSYLEAIVALNEFSREVQHRCTDVLRRNLPALGDAINLQLNSIPIQPKQYPDPISHEKWTAQRGTSLGAGISLKENGLTLDLEVYWWLDEGGEVPSILASATISLWNKGKFERAWPKFEKSQAKKYEEPGNYCIYFSEHVLAGEMSTLDIKLTTALETLIRAWVEAGGLKAFLQ